MTQTTTKLTKENAMYVSTIVSIAHPEWGTQRFFYNSQNLNDGKMCHTFGKAGESVLFDSDMKFWAVASFKSNTPNCINKIN